MLKDALRRALRHPKGGVVPVLHLSRLTPPAPRPHHRRIAHAILQDMAQQRDGQVVPMRNTDLALLCRRPALSAGESASLPATLARLFLIDVADPARLLSV